MLRPIDTIPPERWSAIERLIRGHGHDAVVKRRLDVGSSLKRHVPADALPAVEVAENACGLSLLVRTLDEALDDRDVQAGIAWSETPDGRSLTKRIRTRGRAIARFYVTHSELLWSDFSRSHTSPLATFHRVLDAVGEELGQVEGRPFARLAPTPLGTNRQASLRAIAGDAFVEKWYRALDRYDDRVETVFQSQEPETVAGGEEPFGGPFDHDTAARTCAATCVRGAAADAPPASAGDPPEARPDAARIVRTRLYRAFRILRERGFFVRANWMCCQNCGWKAVPPGTEHFVFWNEPSDDHLTRYAECWLTWNGDGDEIAAMFRRVGLAVEWDGTAAMRIGVSLPVDGRQGQAPTGATPSSAV